MVIGLETRVDKHSKIADFQKNEYPTNVGYTSRSRREIFLARLDWPVPGARDERLSSHKAYVHCEMKAIDATAAVPSSPQTISKPVKYQSIFNHSCCLFGVFCSALVTRGDQQSEIIHGHAMLIFLFKERFHVTLQQVMRHTLGNRGLVRTQRFKIAFAHLRGDLESNMQELPHVWIVVGVRRIMR